MEISVNLKWSSGKEINLTGEEYDELVNLMCAESSEEVPPSNFPYTEYGNGLGWRIRRGHRWE